MRLSRSPFAAVLRFTVLSIFYFGCQHAAALEVGITKHLKQFSLMHNDRPVTIQRNQDTDSMLEFNFALTSRPCPPFCAQPITVDSGVRTIGEVELTNFMRSRLTDGSGLLIDARTPSWHKRGTIPGSINIPYTQLHPSYAEDQSVIDNSLSSLGATKSGDSWSFADAKHLAVWCNGPWCGQSPTAIRGLLKLGYPADKILYYRGGMQLWRIFGLTVVSPDGRVLDE